MGSSASSTQETLEPVFYAHTEPQRIRGGLLIIYIAHEDVVAISPTGRPLARNICTLRDADISESQ